MKTFFMWIKTKRALRVVKNIVEVCRCNRFSVISLQNVTMVRLPVAKSCFLSEGTDDVPKPAELLQLLVSLISIISTFFL